jgi:polyphosphate glucokinase
MLGIDIGGSGIKGAPVDLVNGTLLVERHRIETPDPSTPAACAYVVAQIAELFGDQIGKNTPIGITFPGVVQGGKTLTAANVDHGWIGHDADAMLEEQLKRKVTVLNDAQAAVLGEVRFGAGKGIRGMVLMLTFGTGIGSGLAYNGVALPGVELGHLRMHGVDAEKLASANVKELEKLSWKKWTERVNDYLQRLEAVLWPELIIVGGGVSEKGEKFIPQLKARAQIVAAELGNGAGIVGAAIAASEA